MDSEKVKSSALKMKEFWEKNKGAVLYGAMIRQKLEQESIDMIASLDRYVNRYWEKVRMNEALDHVSK